MDTGYITALCNTYFKKDWRLQASELPDNQKMPAGIGSNFKVELCEEREEGEEGEPSKLLDLNGHFRVSLADHDNEEWYIFGRHWQLPWQVIVAKNETPIYLPEYDQVNWHDWTWHVSKYFTVGEVTLRDKRRIPSDDRVKKNIIAVAREADEIREWWGSPLGVNSWYRPWDINRAIGSKAPNHPNGWAIDLRPLDGSIWEFQKRFEEEWYKTGKWKGGFGKGANRGFIHIDLGKRRCWNY
jgi:hypothetical protein